MDRLVGCVFADPWEMQTVPNDEPLRTFDCSNNTATEAEEQSLLFGRVPRDCDDRHRDRWNCGRVDSRCYLAIGDPGFLYSCVRLVVCNRRAHQFDSKYTSSFFRTRVTHSTRIDSSVCFVRSRVRSCFDDDDPIFGWQRLWSNNCRSDYWIRSCVLCNPNDHCRHRASCASKTR